MKICIASSTEPELELLKKRLANSHAACYFLQHGVGPLHAMYHLQNFFLHHPCDLLIQCGVAGSYSSKFETGEVVFVKSDQFECGAEEQDGSLLTLTDLKLENGGLSTLINPLANPWNIPEVEALTVSVASGSSATISRRKKSYPADIETMEGAACHYVALKTGLPFYQIRGISNKVEPRNRENWKMKEAIEGYTELITPWILSL